MKTTEQKNAEAVIAMQKRIDELKAELAEQKKETAAGKALWVDAQKRCKARYLQCEQLQADLEKYADHLPNCEFMWKEDKPRKCTCGLEPALKGTENGKTKRYKILEKKGLG